MGKSDKDIIEDMSRNPFYMSLTKEEFELMKQDEEIKNKVMDFRDKLECRNTNIEVINFLEKRRQQTEFHQSFNELGGFVFIMYQRLGVMFDNKILSQEDKSKMLLLATYMGYDNVLRFDNNRIIKLEHMPGLLRISRQATYTFLKNAKDLNIINKNEDGSYSISSHLLCKGEVEWNINKSDDFGYTRIFINTYRYLYETLDKRKLKYLGVIFNILGYINFYHNVLVMEDASEMDYEKIKPMTLDQMYEICHNKSDVAKSTKLRFKYALGNIKLDNNQSLFAFVRTDGNDKILINPHITYASSNIDTWNSTLKIIFNNVSNKDKE